MQYTLSTLSPSKKHFNPIPIFFQNLQMGCCFSKSKPQNEYTHQKPSPPKPNPTHEVSPPPPPQPPQFEEESVKEVLSETPITKPHHQVPILTPETDTLLPPNQNPDVKLLETENPIPNPVIIINKKEEKEEETSEVVSQLSEEPCSVNESFSTTTTITEKREDEVTSKRSVRERTTTTTTTKAQKLNNNRSPLRKRLNAVDGNIPGGRERRMKSPARRTEPSPEKKLHGGIRSVRGRESGAAANRKLNVASGGVRRDAGEGSGRRSRSPSCTRTAGKAGPPGGGRKQVPAANGTVEKKEKKGENGSNEIEQKNDVVSQEESTGEKNDVVSQEESIENPLVSMECFIFL